MRYAAWFLFLLQAPAWGQQNVRYYFDGQKRVQLEEATAGTLHAWRIVARARILERVREFESKIPFFRSFGANRDALAIVRSKVMPAATELLFKTLETTGQAQRLRVFRVPGKSAPAIEYPELFVKLRPGMNAEALRRGLILKGYRPGAVQDALQGWAFVEVKVPSETLALADVLNHMPSLAVYAEPNLQWVLSATEDPPQPPSTSFPGWPAPPGAPNDPLFPNQWALHQPSGISILPLWRTPASAGQKVAVAVIDAPIDLNHPDLLPVLDLERQFNATSSDPAGQKKLVYPPDPLKRSDHGTACAGIIAAVRGNGTGIAGVASNISLIPVQVIRQDGAVEVVSAAYIAQGIRYAAAAGASVLSLSANVETVDDIFSVRDALNDLRDGPSSRVLVVNSAGNDLYGNLNGIAFPARYSGVYPFVVGVGATDRCGALKTKIISPTNCDTQTNWGSRRDDIDGTLLAPGVEITTTSNVQVPHDGSNPKNYRRNFSGTSAAAPFVAGVAAMLFAAHPNWTAQQVRTQLMEGSDHIPGTPHRRLNACAVLGTCAAIVSAVH